MFGQERLEPKAARLRRKIAMLPRLRRWKVSAGAPGVRTSAIRRATFAGVPHETHRRLPEENIAAGDAPVTEKFAIEIAPDEQPAQAYENAGYSPKGARGNRHPVF
jgi:hypothetical protein